MRKILILLIVVILGSSYIKASSLSKDARVSVLTILPGEELYSIFGHTKIRIYDPELKIDVVYDYGIFDFDTPNFYLKFLRGNMQYQVDRSDAKRTFHYIPYYNRTVFEQQLNLTLEERTKLFELLETNYLPENRLYLYDFLYDNCATRVRDIIADATDRKIIFNHSNYLDKTFRDLLNEKANHSFLFDFGLNILMGTNVDKKIAPLEYMFLPEYVMEIYNKSDISSDTASNSFSNEPILIYESTKKINYNVKKLAMKVVWAIALIILGITILEFYNKKYYRIIDIILFGISGFLGLQFVILWLGSLHTVFENNLNVFWVLPTNLWIAILIIRKKIAVWTKWHAIAAIAFSAIILLGWNHLPQRFSYTFIPFILILTIRQYSYLRNYLKVTFAFRK